LGGVLLTKITKKILEIIEISLFSKEESLAFLLNHYKHLFFNEKLAGLAN